MIIQNSKLNLESSGTLKKQVFIVIFLILIFAIVSLAVSELRHTITIEIGGEKQVVTVWAWTVRDALKNADIKVYTGDIITPEEDERLPDGGQIFVDRSFWVSITADGETRSIWTTERLPYNLLTLAEVTLNPDDGLHWNGLPISVDKPLPIAMSHSLQVQRATLVNVTQGTQQFQSSSTAASLGFALWNQGILLKNIDSINPGLISPLDGPAISASIQRAKNITIQHANGITQSQVIADRVGEALSEAGMPLQGLDYSIPPEDSAIPISNTIKVVRVHEEVIVESEPLPFGFLTQPLEDVELDTQQVVQVGEYGLMAKRQRVVYEDGVEVSRQTEDEWIAREPKPRIVGYGTKINIRTMQTPNGPIEYWRAVEVYGSTYSPCRSGGEKCYPNTSSGKPVQKGVIAVTLDWYRYMQGLPAYVPNYGFGTIEDVGGGLPDRHWIDLGYSDEDWVGWGGWMTIYFLTPVPENIMWILQ
jgi:uncharacterized protein YabE (DUF348 family)